MALIIKLQRNKTNKLISYNIIVTQKHRSPSSIYIEKIGHYNIHNKFMLFNMDIFKKWISRGAILSPSTHIILKKFNINILTK